MQVRSILGTLMDVLTTPSGEVQRAVSDCLSPLMPAVSGDRAYVESLIKLLLQRLTKGSSYGDRSALTLAEVVGTRRLQKPRETPREIYVRERWERHLDMLV